MKLTKGQRILIWVVVVILVIVELSILTSSCPFRLEGTSATCESNKVWQAIIVGMFLFGLLFLLFGRGKGDKDKSTNK